jgi:hypothetical protein
MNTHSAGIEPLAQRSRTLRRADRIGPLADVNSQSLRWLIKVSSHPKHAESDFLGAISGRLCALSAAERNYAARFPFLLVDLRLRDLDWWQHVASHTATALSRSPWLTPLPPKLTTKLARSTLVLAWHTARVDQEAALLLLGLSRPVADLIAGLHLPDVDRISERHYQYLRPRWDNQPSVWKHLLDASRTGDQTASTAFVLRGLQLVAGHLVPCKD